MKRGQGMVSLTSALTPSTRRGRRRGKARTGAGGPGQCNYILIATTPEDGPRSEGGEGGGTSFPLKNQFIRYHWARWSPRHFPLGQGEFRLPLKRRASILPCPPVPCHAACPPPSIPPLPPRPHLRRLSRVHWQGGLLPIPKVSPCPFPPSPLHFSGPPCLRLGSTTGPLSILVPGQPNGLHLPPGRW